MSSESTSAYADFATEVLATRGDELPEDVRSTFDTYIIEWRALAAEGPTVVWAKEIEVEVCEYLVLAFYRLAQEVDDAHRGNEPVRPTAAIPFYQALVDALLLAMSESGTAAAEFSDQLRSFWPGRSEG